MINQLLFLYKLRFLFAGILTVVSIFLLSLLLVSLEPINAEVRDKDRSANVLVVEDSPNAVSDGMLAAAAELGDTVETAAYVAGGGLQSAARMVVHGGKVVARGAQVGAVAAARGVGSGLASAGRVVGGGTVAVLRTPGKVLGAVSDTSVVRAVIRPSDHVEVPVIDPNSPELKAALKALPPKKNTRSARSLGASRRDAGPVWPMHGTVTTEFGVSHWPYQHTHTGLDISDGREPGITPIKSFRPGRVIEAAYSSYGLGNHVVVDHGNGVTSVYGHLNSISVEVGQKVTLRTVLGYEGSTGVSTGSHLHFEIRVNGQAADPGRFISGHP